MAPTSWWRPSRRTCLSSASWCVQEQRRSLPLSLWIQYSCHVQLSISRILTSTFFPTSSRASTKPRLRTPFLPATRPPSASVSRLPFSSSFAPQSIVSCRPRVPAAGSRPDSLSPSRRRRHCRGHRPQGPLWRSPLLQPRPRDGASAPPRRPRLLHSHGSPFFGLTFQRHLTETRGGYPPVRDHRLHVRRACRCVSVSIFA